MDRPRRGNRRRSRLGGGLRPYSPATHASERALRLRVPARVLRSRIAGAESHLSDVEGERESLNLRDLPSATHDRYLDEWRQAETRFVSDPRDATRAAERLVVRVLHERGYPESDDDGRLVSLVSADHPDIADLRKAMLDFRAVLEDVLQSTRTAA